MDPTAASVLSMYALMGLFVLGAALFLARALKTGAVSGDEAPKYRMLQDDAPVLETKRRKS